MRTILLATPDETRANLAASGFTIESERDTTEAALAYGARSRALVEAGAKPPLRERRAVPVESICRKVQP